MKTTCRGHRLDDGEEVFPLSQKAQQLLQKHFHPEISVLIPLGIRIAGGRDRDYHQPRILAKVLFSLIFALSSRRLCISR